MQKDTTGSRQRAQLMMMAKRAPQSAPALPQTSSAASSSSAASGVPRYLYNGTRHHDLDDQLPEPLEPVPAVERFRDPDDEASRPARIRGYRNEAADDYVDRELEGPPTEMTIKSILRSSDYFTREAYVASGDARFEVIVDIKRKIATYYKPWYPFTGKLRRNYPDPSGFALFSQKLRNMCPHCEGLDAGCALCRILAKCHDMLKDEFSCDDKSVQLKPNDYQQVTSYLWKQWWNSPMGRAKKRKLKLRQALIDGTVSGATDVDGENLAAQFRDEEIEEAKRYQEAYNQPFDRVMGPSAYEDTPHLEIQRGRILTEVEKKRDQDFTTVLSQQRTMIAHKVASGKMSDLLPAATDAQLMKEAAERIESQRQAESKFTSAPNPPVVSAAFEAKVAAIAPTLTAAFARENIEHARRVANGNPRRTREQMMRDVEEEVRLEREAEMAAAASSAASSSSSVSASAATPPVTPEPPSVSVVDTAAAAAAAVHVSIASSAAGHPTAPMADEETTDKENIPPAPLTASSPSSTSSISDPNDPTIVIKPKLKRKPDNTFVIDDKDKETTGATVEPMKWGIKRLRVMRNNAPVEETAATQSELTIPDKSTLVERCAIETMNTKSGYGERFWSCVSKADILKKIVEALQLKGGIPAAREMYGKDVEALRNRKIAEYITNLRREPVFVNIDDFKAAFHSASAANQSMESHVQSMARLSSLQEMKLNIASLVDIKHVQDQTSFYNKMLFCEGIAIHHSAWGKENPRGTLQKWSEEAGVLFRCSYQRLLTKLSLGKIARIYPNVKYLDQKTYPWEVLEINAKRLWDELVSARDTSDSVEVDKRWGHTPERPESSSSISAAAEGGFESITKPTTTTAASAAASFVSTPTATVIVS